MSQPSDHTHESFFSLCSTHFIGFAVILTLMDPVLQGLWASYHVFGVLSFGHGVCTTILTLTAAACVRKKTVMSDANMFY